MASRLAPCPSCTRHVKVGTSSCPFCGGEVPTDVPQRVNLAAGKPLTRAAIMFAGAAAVSACSSSTTTGTGSTETSSAKSSTSQSEAFSAVAAYGCFAPDCEASAYYPSSTTTSSQASGHASSTATTEEIPDGGFMAAYGAMIPGDGGI